MIKRLKCCLCPNLQGYADMVPLSSCVHDAEHLEILIVRMSPATGSSVPLLCRACGEHVENCRERAATSLQTQLGQDLYETGVSHFTRDRTAIEEFYKHGERGGVYVPVAPCSAVDTKGHLHLHVQCGKTCKWEPYIGRSAESARSRGLQLQGNALAQKLAASVPWYTSDGSCRPDHDIDPNITGAKLHATLLQHGDASTFFKPF